LDDAQEGVLRVAANNIENALNGATCEQLQDLHAELMFQARSLPAAMTHTADMLCGNCETEGAYNPLPQELADKLELIKKEIAGEIKSSENWIVSYVDAYGLVMEPPRIEGSRAKLDYNRDDEDCPPDEEPLKPGEEPVAPGEEPPFLFSDGTPIPEGYQVCDSELLASYSKEGPDCYDCRECMYNLCPWDSGSFCKKVFKGTEAATSDQWLACLESNGVVSNSLPGDAEKEHGFDNWCHCAVTRDRRCLRRENRLDECGAANMKDKNCGTCRACLKDRCGHWEENLDTYFMDLLNGSHGNMNADQWLACLESDGQNKDLDVNTSGKAGAQIPQLPLGDDSPPWGR
jgi:hypothetical protein